MQTEADAQYRSKPEDISKIYVRAQNGQGVRHDSARHGRHDGISQAGRIPVTHFNGYNTALVLGAAAPGYSSGQALEALDQVAKEVLVPQGYGHRMERNFLSGAQGRI